MKKTRKLKKTIGIVGEGPTEWSYFNYIRTTRRFRFSLKPDLPCSSDCKGVFKKARELKNKGYDLVFCIIDVDTIFQTRKLNEFKTTCSKLPQNIIPITSKPCIEIWFLMHFLKNPSSKVYSNCDSLIPILKSYIPEYAKSKNILDKHKVFTKMEDNNGKKKAFKNSKEILNKILIGKNLEQFSYSEIVIVLEQLQKCQQCPFVSSCTKCIKEITTFF